MIFLLSNRFGELNDSCDWDVTIFIFSIFWDLGIGVRFRVLFTSNYKHVLCAQIGVLNTIFFGQRVDDAGWNF